MATAYLTPGVYVEEVDRGTKPIEGVSTAVAAFVGLAPMGPVGTPTMVANWTQFTETFGSFSPGAYLAHAVYGYFNNGGGLCYVVRVNGEEGAPAIAAPAAAVELPARADDSPPTIRAESKDPEAREGLSVDVSVDEEGNNFTLTVKHGRDTESFENLTMGRGRNAFEIVNAESKLVTLVDVARSGLNLGQRIPTAGTYALVAQPPAPVETGGVKPAAFEGDVAERTGLGGLEAIDNVTMVCAPDVMAGYQSGALDSKAVQAVQQALIDHCERMGDRVAILDPLPGLNVQAAADWRMKETGYDSKYAALYYPWVEVADPTPEAPRPTTLIPPSGHIAGVWARNDDTRGVFKAPANETIAGAVGLEMTVTDSEQGVLNPNGVNCIRAFPGRGIRIWGARTLSSDPSWRYINVRRLFNFLEKSIQQGTQWAVFEPNDYALWQRMKRDISSFLKTQWMAGALFGATPDQAFFVKCDEENNPQETRDLGQLYVDIGVAPVKPAEFVIFRIGQYAPEV